MSICDLSETAIEEESGGSVDREMPLTEHLAELRKRIIICLVCWLGGCCLCYGLAPRLLEAIRASAGEGFYFVFTSPTEAFMAFVKLSMVVSLFACLPVFIYHTVAFVCPGLTERERRWLLRLVPFALLLFAAGVLFAWFVALPIMWRFFLGFQSESVRALWSIGEVVGFVVGAMLLCGLIFQTPLVMIFLAALDIVNLGALQRARRVVYFGACVASAIITPTPDAFTAVVVAVPLIVFYEISLLMIRMLRLGQ
ncbi:twin-arginine translocase subunit TatC [bacterium]|nr:twin-arginine translocase subunit TatC [bacterium]